MWKTLEKKYEKKGLPGQLFLKKKLLSMKLREGESLEKFLTEFEDVIRQLKAAGAKLEEQDIVCNLLISLPKSYETVVTVIENLDSADQKYEIVKQKLLAEAEKKTLSSGKKETFQEQTAFWTNKHKQCYRCGEAGHFKRDCRKKYYGNQRNQDSDCGQVRENVMGTRYYSHSQSGNNSRLPHNQVHQQNNTQRSQVGNRGRYFRSNYPDTSRSNYANSNQQAEECNQDGQDQTGGICFMGERSDREDYEDSNNLKIFIDSGCTDHMVNNISYFSNFINLKKPIKIAVAKDSNYLLATGVGNINVYSLVEKDKVKCTIKNVFFVPNLRKNLLSVKRLEMANVKVIFENGGVKLVQPSGYVIGIGKRNNLYEISFTLSNPECHVVENMNDDFIKWHRRYGHLSFSGLEKLIKGNLVNGIDKNINIHKVEFCETCINAKMHRLPFGSRVKSSRVLEIIHSDVCGPITPITHDGYKYFVTFIDDFSNFTMVYLIKNKNEVLDKFKEYFLSTSSLFNCQISKLRCDNGGEYISTDFRNFCKSKGIMLDYTVPYTPQQNGKAERMNRTLVEKGRAMIDESGVDKQFWGEAIRCATYILNRSPACSLPDKTPAEIWLNRKPDVSNLRIFGSVAYSHIPKEFRHKFDTKTKKCLMVGYSPTGYRLWDIDQNKIIVSRDVLFNENEFLYKSKIVDLKLCSDLENNSENSLKEDLEVKSDEQNVDEISNEIDKTKETHENYIREHRRISKLPAKYEDYEIYMAFDAVSYVNDVPLTYEELQNRNDKQYWYKAVERELKSISDNDTWEEVVKPDKKVLDTKWVFTYKNLESNIDERYKARLCVRGFAQEKDIDYSDIYSPVASMNTIRTFLVVGNQFNYYFEQLDVKTAFLNAPLVEDVFIYPPKGVACESGKVFKLNKSLYGLKQSSKCWNDEINIYLLKLGFMRSINDFCMYSLHHDRGNVYLLIYVDDIVISGPNIDLINEVKNKLMTKFKMKDKGNLKYFLGLEIDYNREQGIMKISQSNYIESVLKRFNMYDCKTSNTPIDPKLKLNICNNRNLVTKKPFREMVGCLMYLMLGSRPDICFTVNYFSRFQDKATDETWNHLKRVLRYLKGTKDIGLKFRRGENTDLLCYVDADWGGDQNDRKSVTGFLFKVFGNSVIWVTRKQSCVSLSTAEAELVALCAAVCEGLWLKKLLKDFDIKFKNMIFFEDNQSCIALAQNPANNKRVKHIDLKYNFVHENIKTGNINIKYCETNQQQADILTKGLPYPNFEKFRYLLGLRNFNEDFSEEGCRYTH